MAVLQDGELILYGFVGESFWGDGFTSREVIDALAEHGRDQDIVVRINSGGGYVDDGVAIFNALSNHKGKVTVIVDAMAASSASIIAMAGQERIMRKGSMLMIHDPSSVVWGTAEDMAKAIKMLEKHAENLASIYADVTGEDVEDIRADMKDETWLTADEAVDRGFATSASDRKAKAAAAHDYTVYAHAPERLVALSGKKNWSHAGLPEKAAASAKALNLNQQGNTKMAEKTEADNNAAETAKAIAAAATAAKDRIKAIMTAEDAKGRETLAEHFAYNTEMSADDAITALKAAPKAAAGKAEDEDEGDKGKAYEKGRTNASGLAQPGGREERPAAKNLNPTSIYAARREALKH
jgi:ATP-dependent protease ClpP protease subunit